MTRAETLANWKASFADLREAGIPFKEWFDYHQKNLDVTWKEIKKDGQTR